MNNAYTVGSYIINITKSNVYTVGSYILNMTKSNVYTVGSYTLNIAKSNVYTVASYTLNIVKGNVYARCRSMGVMGHSPHDGFRGKKGDSPPMKIFIYHPRTCHCQ